jgi:hypothetical protein
MENNGSIAATGLRRKAENRRPTAEFNPTRMPRPSVCTNSRLGYTHVELLTHSPTGLPLSHARNAISRSDRTTLSNCFSRGV